MGEQPTAPDIMPCPFCGASAGDIKLSRGHGYIVGCGTCQAQQFAMKHEDAVALWNARTELARDPEQVIRLVDEATQGLLSMDDRKDLLESIAALPLARAPEGDWREAAVHVIEQHQAQEVCHDNCWTTIKATIRSFPQHHLHQQSGQ